MTYKSLIYTKEEIFVSHTIQKPKNINGAKYASFLFYIVGRKGCPSSIGPQRTSVIDFFAECSAVKLDDKQRLNKEQSGVKEFLPSWEMLKFGFRGHSTTTWTLQI